MSVSPSSNSANRDSGQFAEYFYYLKSISERARQFGLFEHLELTRAPALQSRHRWR